MKVKDMGDYITECPICTEVLVEREPRRLSCNPSHVFCSECLENIAISLRLQSGDEFPCPICKTISKWPKLGVDGFPEVHFEDETDDCGKSNKSNLLSMKEDNFAENFYNDIMKEIEKTKLKRSQELGKLKNEIDNLKQIIDKKEACLRDKLETFFDEKENKLQEILEESEFLKNIPALSGSRVSLILKENFDVMKEDLLHEKEMTAKKDAYLKTVKNLDSLEIGSIIILPSDKPSNERSIRLNGQIALLRYCNDGIFVINSGPGPTCYNIETKSSLSFHRDRSIIDFCIGRDGYIYFLMENLKHSKKLYMIDTCFNQEKFEIDFKETPILSDPSFLSSKDHIYFTRYSNLMIYEKRSKRLLSMDLKLPISNVKAKDELVFVLFKNGTIKELDIGKGKTNFIDVKLDDGKISVRNDIISPLLKGNLLLCDEQRVYIVFVKEKKAISYRHRKILKHGKIFGYRISKDEFYFITNEYELNNCIVCKYFDI
ncbi:unnamed protein product [Dimorphilus gyrociliatus]|uniref:RING-type domain-containing protein n=1 Tax=Dimorphilus gyrociliatus TaxID=2664684 RepID=A0A7I8VEC6_9ANNE|nr:unnamed protein product [Dimorphilus gyrociliatus]